MTAQPHLGDPAEHPSRRTAIRALVGGAAAVAVWAEPTIKGLARRPAYAASGSGSTTAGSDESISNPAPDTIIASATADDGTQIGLQFTTDDRGCFFITAIPRNPDCECRIVGISDSNSTGFGSDGLSLEARGEIIDGVLKFTIRTLELTAVKWAGLKIECQ